MKTLRNFSLLAIAFVLVSASLQCRRPEGSAPATTQPTAQGETATTQPGAGLFGQLDQPAAPMDFAVVGKDAHENSAKLAVADIQQMIDAKDFDRAKAMVAAAQPAYADTSAAAQLAALAKSIGDSVAAAPAKVDPATLSQADQDALHDQSVKDRDAALAKLAASQPAEAVTLLQASLRQENDPNTQALLQQATIAAEGKPRLAVAQFDVIGDVGIGDAGRAVPELLLSKFDLTRFQLVDRTALNCALADQGLSVAQVTENPALLRIKKVSAVRYLVVGSVVKVGTLAVSARLVDAASGDIVQTADVTAVDAVGLQNSLAELASVLQMTNDEKATYLAYKQRQQEAQTAATAATDTSAQPPVDTSAQPPVDVTALPPDVSTTLPPTDAQYQADLQAERDRLAAAQADAFQNSQRQRDAAVALAQVQALLVRGDANGARGYAAWALVQFGDTDAGAQLAAMQAAIQAACDNQDALQRNADDWARTQREQRQRYQRYCAFRDRGMAALAANDLLGATAAFQSALREQDDPNLRALLDQIVQAAACPGLAVLDFAIQPDLAGPDAGPALAAYMLDQFARISGRFRLIPRDQFLARVSQSGLTLDALMANPAAPQAATVRLLARFVVTGQVTRGRGGLDVITTLVDLNAGQPVQQARGTAQKFRRVPQTLTDLAAFLQMTDAERLAFTRQQDYATWMAKADAAIAAGRWDEALGCYRRANEINPTNETRDGISNMTLRIAGLQQARQNYDAAMLAGQTAANAGDWFAAMNAYQQALSIMNTPDARNALANARKNARQAADANKLYANLMADAQAAANAGNWARARDDYQQAVAINPTPDAQAGLKLAQTTLDQQFQDRRRQYDRAIGEARAAVRAGDWQKALDAYMRAAGIQDTPETRSGIASARQALAQQAVAAKAYDTAMADGAAAAQAGDWAKAVDAYQRALAINRTRQAQASLAQAQQKLADQQRQAQLQRLYDQAMAEGNAAAKAGDWKRALDSYTKAGAIINTAQAQDGIATAKQHLADAAAAAANANDKKKNYDAAMAEASADAKAGNWQGALDAYIKAASFENTPEVRAGIVAARKHLADDAAAAAAAADKKRNYDAAIANALAFAKAGEWQKALDDYTKAASIDDTRLAEAGIANAKKHLADAAAAALAGGDKKKNYDAAMAEAQADAQAGNWQAALDAYTKAAGIDATRAAEAGIANAKKHLADAAAAALTEGDKKKNYDTAMADAATHAKAGEWQAALDDYTKAAGIDDTRLAEAGIANAKKHLADAAAATLTAGEKKKNYDAAMADALAHARAGEWQKALDDFTKASGIDNTPEAQAGIVAAKKHLAEDAATTTATGEKKKNYDAAMADALAHAKAGEWQKALDDFTKAAGIDNTPEAQAGIVAAKKHLADEAAALADNKKKYDAAMAEARVHAGARDWQGALDAYTKASTFLNTAEAQAGIAAAKKHLADAALDTTAAAEKKKNYDAAMADAATHAKAGDWQAALDDYTKAAGIDNTRLAEAGIANAKKHLADAALGTTAAAEKKKNYDAAMADAATHVKAGDWQAALDDYTKAAGIDATRAAEAGIANAKKHLADAAAAAAEKKKNYDTAMADAATHAKAGDWQAALDDYTKAAGIDNTRLAEAGIANAKKHLADAAAATSAAAAEKKKNYDAAMAEALADVNAGNWQKALAAYTKAAGFENTADAQAGIAAAKKHIADAAAAAAAAGDKKKNYDAAMAEALADAKAGNWQKALDSYTKAAGIDNTADAQAGIASARKWVAYQKLMADALAAFNASDWATALTNYTGAAALENTPAAQSGIALTKKKWYDKCMADGAAAAAAQQWLPALNAYTKAYDLIKTPEAKAGIDLAKKKLGQ